jgi:hypothetical protein
MARHTQQEQKKASTAISAGQKWRRKAAVNEGSVATAGKHERSDTVERMPARSTPPNMGADDTVARAITAAFHAAVRDTQWAIDLALDL